MASKMPPVLLCLLFIGVHGIIIKQNGSKVSANTSAPSVSRLYRNVPFKMAYAKQMPHLMSAVRPSSSKGPVVAASKVVTVKSNISAPNVTRLYRNVPHAIYASGAPHGHKPVFGKGPETAASHYVPVKEEQIVIHNKKGYLKDSYGNSFITTPQMVAYKMTLPHQYVKLQDLPKHLSQPLTAASSGSFYKNAPQFSYGTPHRPSSHQAYSQAPKLKTSNISQPQKLSGNLKTFAPTHSYRTFSNVPVSSLIPESSKHKEIYSNNYPHYSTSSEEEFERLLKSPNARHVWHDLQVPQNLPTKIITGKPQKITTGKAQKITTGNAAKNENLKSPITSQSKKVPVKAAQQTIILETKPPLPHLLDLSLLEPLTFENPIVPQVQHFLPKINYYIPKVDEEKQHHNEYVVQKTMYYDSGLIKNPQNNKIPHAEESSDEEDSSEVEDDSREVEDEEEAPSERPPSQHVKVRVQSQPPQESSGEEDENPEFAVNNKSPNYKETLTEEVIRYDNSKESEPQTYSYGSHVTSPPKEYSYSSTSKPYSQQVYIKTNSESINPVKIVNSSNPENPQSEPDSSESDESAEDSGEDTDGPSSGKHNEVPSHTPPPPAPQKQQYQQLNYSPKPTFPPLQSQKYQASPRPNQLDSTTAYFLSSPKFNPALMYKEPKYQKMLMAAYNQMPKPTFLPAYDGKLSYNAPPTYAPPAPQSTSPVTPVPQVKYQTVKTPVDNFGIERYVNKPLEDLEQNIQLSPSPNAKIRVPPGQHINNGFQPSSIFGKNTAQQRKSTEQEHIQLTPSSTFAPNIVEKSHKIIIQEESPDELHSHREQMTAEVIDDGDENDEEDFEAAYKDSAYGFPAFNKDAEQLEKDVYSPSDFAPVSHSEYDFERTPFEQYVDKGDRFPKSARLTYKDDRDDLKENYYLDFSAKTPQTYKDRKEHKDDYYKMYQHNTRPEAFFGPSEERKESKKAEKFIVPPVYTYNLQSSRPTGLFAQYRKVPGSEYDYLKSAPRDNFAHASWSSNKGKSLFVEPKLQYGFEPLTVSRLFDSELSAMSSNLSPQIDKDGTRKKTYKENIVIKRMSTNSDRQTS